MIIVVSIVRWHQPIWKSMNMTRSKVPFWIKRQYRFCQRSAVKESGSEQSIIFFSNKLPVKGLVDNQLSRLGNRQTRSANILTSGAGQYKKAFISKLLNGKLSPEIDAIR